MEYQNIVEGIFIERINRFIAKCFINGKEQTVHVKNTGRCKELLIKDRQIFLEYFPETTRKTEYDLITVNKNGRLVNMDSQIPNKVIYNAIIKEDILGISKNITEIKQEKTYKSSRFDIYCKTDQEEYFIEVKGVTLEENNIAMFPDAPTERGIKHINELIDAKKNGYNAFLIFLIQMENVQYFTPNIKTHEAFGNALINAEKYGVTILAFDSIITNKSININKPVEIRL